jgi:anaerobic magnesium-protoporphyrin IX monomethyl ester cyclase
MKIMFISPPTDNAISKVLGATGPPLSLAYLASMVRDEHDIRLVDSAAEGLGKKQLKSLMKKEDPDLVGLTATTPGIPDAYEIAGFAKEINEDAKVIIGGPHVTFLPEQTLEECPHIDVVVRGEGELTLKELVSVIERGGDLRGVRGISFRSNGNVVNSPPRELIQNLDELPIPAYDMLPMRRYAFEGVQFGAVVTSRGCPFNCVFCSSSLQFGGRWRGHSPGRVIEELSILRNEYGKTEIEFLDDTFTLSKDRAVEISRLIKEGKLDISWTASSRVDIFSREIADAMREGGAKTIYFGLESGSQRVLDFIGKGITPEKSVAAVRCCKRCGLSAVGSFVIGFPDETEEEINATIRLSIKSGVDLAQFTIATPYPGTRLWSYVVGNNLLLTKNWRKFTTLEPVIRLKNFTPSQISRILRFAYLKFYLRPKFVVDDLIRRKGVVLKKMIKSLGALRKD